MNVIGFEIEGVSSKGDKAIRKNAKIPFILRALWSCDTLSKVPLKIRIKLRERYFKRNKNDSTKRLVLKGADELISAIKGEMLKSGCSEGEDYLIEAIEE